MCFRGALKKSNLCLSFVSDLYSSSGLSVAECCSKAKGLHFRFGGFLVYRVSFRVFWPPLSRWVVASYPAKGELRATWVVSGLNTHQ